MDLRSRVSRPLSLVTFSSSHTTLFPTSQSNLVSVSSFQLADLPEGERSAVLEQLDLDSREMRELQYQESAEVGLREMLCRVRVAF